MLERKEIDINHQNSRGYCSFMIAKIHNTKEMFDKLINDPRIDKSLIDGKGISLLSPIYSDSALFSKLIRMKEIDLNVISEDGYTPIHYAIMHKNMDCLLYLLSCNRINVPINYRTKNGSSFLHVAASVKSAYFFNFFAKKGIDINCQDNDGRTPLMILIGQSSPISPLWDSLLKRKKLNINLQDNEGIHGFSF